MNKLEALAELEHEQWAHWTRYMLNLLEPILSKRMRAHTWWTPYKDAYDALDRWKQQIETPYAALSEAEKEADRVWARKVMDLLGHAEGDHIISEEDWDFIRVLLDRHPVDPENPTQEEWDAMHFQITARLGVEKEEEFHDWIASIAEDDDE